MLVLTGTLAGCLARPVGDFGRADHSFTHDTAMPFVGNLLADARDEPVSRFNQTDQEIEMHDRVWRFLVAAHSKDWFNDIAVEWQRTRIIPAVDDRFDTNRYYTWLQGEAYRSSRTRYATVGRHIEADIDTVPTTFAAICAVVEVDRQRAIAFRELPDQGFEIGQDVAARKAENDMFIAWFVRALDYRHQSYKYALEHLLVETPHEQSRAVDAKLAQMSIWVDRANRWDFCGGSGTGYHPGQDAQIPSRYSGQMAVPEDQLPRK